MLAYVKGWSIANNLVQDVVLLNGILGLNKPEVQRYTASRNNNCCESLNDTRRRWGGEG